jgi:uncharacterized membrane protein HdeD (DUF308 family)
MNAANNQVVNRSRSASWGAPFTAGLLVSIAGLVALGATFFAGLVSSIFIGVLLMIAGLFEIGHAIANWRAPGRVVGLLAGLLSLVVGAFFTFWPVAGLGALSLLLAGFFFASGLFRGITSIVDRYANWGWDLLYGVSAVVLGVIIVSQWPVSALWLVGTVVGIELLLRGFSLMAASLALRRVVRHAPRHAAAGAS